MKPLEIHKQIWIWFCVCSADENTSEIKKSIFRVFTLIIILSDLSVIPASVIFALNNLSTDLDGCLHALFQITAYTGISYSMISALILRKKIRSLFDNLTLIYKKRG